MATKVGHFMSLYCKFVPFLHEYSTVGFQPIRSLILAVLRLLIKTLHYCTRAKIGTNLQWRDILRSQNAVFYFALWPHQRGTRDRKGDFLSLTPLWARKQMIKEISSELSIILNLKLKLFFIFTSTIIRFLHLQWHHWEYSENLGTMLSLQLIAFGG